MSMIENVCGSYLLALDGKEEAFAEYLELRHVEGLEDYLQRRLDNAMIACIEAGKEVDIYNW